jgi:hypothetical protein
LLWPAVEPEFARAFDSWVRNDVSSDDEVFIEPVRKTFTAPWRLPPIKPLPGSLTPQDTTDADEEVEFYWVGTGARIAGTIVHRRLQLLAEGRGLHDGADVETERKVTRRWLREMGLGDDMQRGIVERVEAALDGVRRDPKGRWILEGDGHAELALTGRVDGSIESVILDQVRTRVVTCRASWMPRSSATGHNLINMLRSMAHSQAPGRDAHCTFLCYRNL